MKYADLENWRKLDNRYVRPGRRVLFPLKESFDVAQELYFFWEWVHFNLSKGQSSYRYRCVNKALKKASRLVEKSDFKEALDPEGALDLLDEIVLKAQEQSSASKRFSSLVSFDYEEICSREWYRERFHIYKTVPTYKEGKINLGLNSFKFFYCLGVIDSSVLLEEIIPKEDGRLAAALSIEYYLNIEEGRFNQHHKREGENIDIGEQLELLAETDSQLELSRFQHLFKLGALKKAITYWFRAAFSADLKGKVYARMENCRSDDVVFSDRQAKRGERSVNVNFYAYEDFANAILSLTSTFSSFSTFEMDEFLKDSMSPETEGKAIWVAEE